MKIKKSNRLKSKMMFIFCHTMLLDYTWDFSVVWIYTNNNTIEYFRVVWNIDVPYFVSIQEQSLDQGYILQKSLFVFCNA